MPFGFGPIKCSASPEGLASFLKRDKNTLLRDKSAVLFYDMVMFVSFLLLAIFEAAGLIRERGGGLRFTDEKLTYRS